MWLRKNWLVLSPKHVHYPQKHVSLEIIYICQVTSSRTVNCFSRGRNAVEKGLVQSVSRPAMTKLDFLLLKCI